MVFKRIQRKRPDILRKALNTDFTKGAYPEWISESKMVLLQKTKTQPTPHDQIRPIGISSNSSKIYERCILTKLKYWAHKLGVWREDQSGFIHGRGTSHMLNRINAALDTKDAQLIIAVDFVKAFDNVSRNSILDSLVYYGFPNQLISVVHQALEHRLLCFHGPNGTTRIRQTEGTVQAG